MNAIWYSPISDGGGAEVLFFLWAVCLKWRAHFSASGIMFGDSPVPERGNCVSAVNDARVFFSYPLINRGIPLHASVSTRSRGKSEM